MHKHLFLTGEKRIGKTTAINAFLAKSGLRTEGFRTVQVNGFFPGEISVHMTRAGENENPSRENLLFCCSSYQGLDITERFDRIGCEALNCSPSADLILMDELGPHEFEAEKFQKRVFELLRGGKPVLGVLQNVNSAFPDQIRDSRVAYFMEVTQKNREYVPSRIRDWYYM